MLLSVVETHYILNSDFENIRTHFQCNHRNNSRCWPLAHAENPELFHELAASFSREFKFKIRL
jgi:hypothetical protein